MRSSPEPRLLAIERCRKEKVRGGGLRRSHQPGAGCFRSGGGIKLGEMSTDENPSDRAGPDRRRGLACGEERHAMIWPLGARKPPTVPAPRPAPDAAAIVRRARRLRFRVRPE